MHHPSRPALLTSIAALWLLAGCAGEGTNNLGDSGAVDDASMSAADVTVPSGAEVPVEWGTNAESYRGMNNRMIIVRCPPMGNYSVVFGTDIYTDSSSICTAAVHDRRITREGGRVAILVLPGRAGYMGSKGGGHIVSGDWAAWPGSFSVVFPARMP